MRLLFVAATVTILLSEYLALPVGKEGQREDVVTRCLVEVLSKALSKPDSTLDQECKDIIYSGVKHAPAVEKKSIDGAVAQTGGQAEEPGNNGADVKDIETLLKTVGEKRETPEDERSQESWSLGEEREKRSSWRPGRFHQRKHKRDEEAEEDYDRSQESWGVDKREYDDEEGEEVEKRASWRPRYQHRKSKRDEEPLGDDEGDGERSQETWDVDKRIWKPSHRYHHKKKFHSKRGDPDEEDDGERSQESWGLEDERDKRNWRPGRYHQRRTRRDEELSEEARDEPDEERSQEYWDVDPRDKREWRAGRTHQRRHKRDEEYSEPDYDRSQEYWDFDMDKRDWRPGRFHQRRHKRGDEEEGERSQESWGLDKRDEEWDEEGADIEKRVWKPTHRYHHKKRLHRRDGASEEEEAGEDEAGDNDLRNLLEKRNPWIYRGYYHPAWKRSTDLAASGKEKQLNSLAAMDMELQKIAAKLHDKPA